MNSFSKQVVPMNEEQYKVFQIMKSGVNVHLYGEAGTGKSFVLQKFINSLSDEELSKTIIAAPTGIAAINIGGVTLHRLFQIPITILGPDKRGRIPSTVKVADRIIIDEYSMMRFDVFGYVSKTLLDMQAKQKRRIQVIMVGDALQLPPVIRQDEEAALRGLWGEVIPNFYNGFPFVHPNWAEFNFVNCHLTEIMRQTGDEELLINENLARRGNPKCLKWFQENTSKVFDENAVHLCPTNKMASDINREKCAKFKDKVDFIAKVEGNVNSNDKPVDDLIQLAPGMRVMSVVNAMDITQYQNGSLGTIVHIDEENQGVIVQFDNGNRVMVFPHTWDIFRYTLGEDGKTVEKIVDGTYTQIPLRIAYAITIHKSQGQTYDKVTIHPNCFAPGQLYVALSRCKTRQGMYICGTIKPWALKAAGDALWFYNNLFYGAEKQG